MLAMTAQATETEDSDNSASQIWSLTTKRSLIPPIRKEFAWNCIQVTMDIDTGSPVCVIPKSIYEMYCHQWPQLQKSELQLSCYLGRLPLLGAITMPVSYEGTTVQCTLTVLDCDGPSLCGRDLLKKLTDERIQVLNVYPQPSRSSQAQEVILKLLQKNADLFTEGTGLMKGPPARLHIKTGSTPKFFKEPEAETENLTDMVLLIDQLDKPAVSHKELQALTEADAVLQEVCRDHELPKNPGAESASWYFAPGDAVYVRNYGVGDKWTPGKVKSTSGARLVTVATEDGVVRRHVDQVRKRSSGTDASRETSTPEEPPPEGQHRTTKDAPKCEADDLSESPVPEFRRSTRIRKPVERYGY
ncbi:uncharacterized protein LOC125757993 [Rhipicephalus sanguineus]|uniref:uncharacterized protein LOC125757993 n=1 Tax=Rhipicephalus sanguineus TaxID=34632 RepID=UPI0020C4176B|nr:uncharacterized protein LOC125757993 [Rhipicephalus sanguineus]